jgi:hypothetical protein
MEIMDGGYFELCTCSGAETHPHVYFYPNAGPEFDRFPYPLFSIMAVEVFLEMLIGQGLVSETKRIELLDWAKETRLPMDAIAEEEKIFITGLKITAQQMDSMGGYDFSLS